MCALALVSGLGLASSLVLVTRLTMSLVNVSLKFQMLISSLICHYFLLKKCEKLYCKSFSHFFNKNISVFGYKVIKHLTS